MKDSWQYIPSEEEVNTLKLGGSLDVKCPNLTSHSKYTGVCAYCFGHEEISVSLNKQQQKTIRHLN